MKTSELNGHATAQSTSIPFAQEPGEIAITDTLETPEQLAPETEQNSEAPTTFVTRNDLDSHAGLNKKKLLLLGGGLLVAILFFVFTALLGKSPGKTKHPAPLSPSQESSGLTKGSVTPVTDAVRKPASDDLNGQLSPGDIKRTRAADNNTVMSQNSSLGGSQRPGTKSGASLASVPPFSDTQQGWEEPKPYGTPSESPQPQPQMQNALKESSIIFVRNQVGSGVTAEKSDSDPNSDIPVLQIKPGTRVQAKLETQISSAVLSPVVAVIEYTYAIGNQIIIPAGARVYGQLRQADRSGYVDVKFDEIELLDGAREKIDAIGAGLDLGPIKGAVYGKNTGKNFLVRAGSGIGSVAAMIVGNSTNSAFSEGDLIRQRVAQNIGSAGDTELMSLNVNTRIVVSVPADTKIYIVFTKHEQTPSTLRSVAANEQ